MADSPCWVLDRGPGQKMRMVEEEARKDCMFGNRLGGGRRGVLGRKNRVHARSIIR